MWYLWVLFIKELILRREIYIDWYLTVWSFTKYLIFKLNSHYATNSGKIVFWVYGCTGVWRFSDFVNDLRFWALQKISDETQMKVKGAVSSPYLNQPKGFKREDGDQQEGIISTLQCHHPCALSMLPPTQVTWCYGPSVQILYKMIILIFHAWSCVVILELLVM
jgi:hypothetical protein